MSFRIVRLSVRMVFTRLQVVALLDLSCDGEYASLVVGSGL